MNNMIVKQRYKGFICLTAHPTGCKENVKEQIAIAKQIQPQNGKDAPKNVLIIGGSTGYGLASRIVSIFGYGANTCSISFEKEAGKGRTATPGWYNNQFVEEFAKKENIYTTTINGDAFSDEIKTEVIETIKQNMGKIDLIIYSLASPRRKHPKTGEEFRSVLKPIGNAYTNKTIDFHTGIVSEVTIEPATQEEIEQTIQVMGGEDWEMWIDALKKADVLAPKVETIAYSYIGPEVTHPIYTNGTIGMAKKDVERAAKAITKNHETVNAYVSVNKAVVTQASSAIPVVPLYMSLLFKIMDEKGIGEGCIEQMKRLFEDRLYSNDGLQLDDENRIRIDDWEMRKDVQEEIARIWPLVDSNSIESMGDLEQYRNDFFRLFGFGFPNVDYEEDVQI